jgi:7-keto-8-aminopelargonate synthetase-like enzyme
MWHTQKLEKMSKQYINTLTQIIENGLDQKLIHHTVQDQMINGRTILVNHQNLINFGSCSYLGLETDPRLKSAAIEAVRKYGTQFSSSRTYASIHLYNELEHYLHQIFGKPAIVSASTTLGHLATLPVIISENDAVILDMQVHSSVQMAVKMLKAEGINVQVIRHNNMERLEDKIKSLRGKYQKIWYLADGVYSMFGDYAPFDRLTELLDTYPQFHVYIDDAHGMSWTGKHGVGVARSKMEHHDKMVLAVSLNKSFASAGGALVFPNQEMAQLVRNCGGPMIFSGPIQPPMLGVACESARLHLSDEIIPLQNHLKQLIDHTNQLIIDSGLPQYEMSGSPLFFIPVGLPRVAQNMVKRLIKEGFYVNSASFPATPMKQCGVRFMANGNLKKEDIRQMIEALHYHYPLAMAEEKMSFQTIEKYFERPDMLRNMVEIKPKQHSKTRQKLSGNLFHSIEEIDVKQWDRLFEGKGNGTHSSMRMLEKTFHQNNTELHHQWSFYYYWVKDEMGQTVLATPFTSTIIKDDMFASASISKKIEVERQQDPTYLTSKVIMLGTMITKGEQLFINRQHPKWKEALYMLIQEMQKALEKHNANGIMLRDFIDNHDEELRSVMLELGLSEVEILDTCMIKDLSWEDEKEYLSRLGQKYRYNVRKEILKYQDQFRVETAKLTTIKELKDAYQLYCNVYKKAFEFNVHQLPFEYFEAINQNPDYDILRLYLKDDLRPINEQKPVAIMFSHQKGGLYNALIVGLDYDYVYQANSYKQILYQTLLRAKALGCQSIDLASTAVLEKKKIGARPYKTYAFSQVTDHFNMAVIEAMAGQE